MGSDAVSHRVAIGLFYSRTNPVITRCVYCKYYSIFSVFCKFLRNVLSLLYKLILSFNSNAINVTLFLCIFELCILLSGDVELNPGPAPSNTPDQIGSSISILHHNIRSLRNKIDDIQHIVEEFDIICFTETHLDDNILDENIKLTGFKSKPFRLDRNCHGGGIILYFKDNINIIPRTDLQMDGVEAMWFEIKTKVGSFLLNVVYRSQMESGANFWNNYSQMVSTALDYSSRLITLGDYNIDFLNRLPTEVQDIINLYGLDNQICDPTRYGNNSFSLLDPILVTDSVAVLEANTIPIERSISDHDPAYIVFSCGYSNATSFKRKVWLYKQGNYDLFRDRILNTDWNAIITEQPDVDTACESFTKTFMDIAQVCIPTNVVTIRPNDKVWMTSELRREIRKRDRLRKKFIQNKTFYNQRKFKDQRNKVNNLKKIAKAEFYVSINETLSELKHTNSKQYWKIIKMLVKGEGQSTNLPPLRRTNDENPTAFDNTDKGNLLNNYFCSISDLHDEDISLPEFDDRGPNTLSNITVEMQDIIDVILTLDPNKAVGPDLVSNRMLKEVKNEVAYPLLLLFNKSLREKKFPSSWKLAYVIPVFKSGDSSLVSNYRPIALLCTISKVFEKIVYKYIFNFFIANALLYKFQSGFIPGHSTSHQLIELIHEILQALDNHELVCLIFCDVSKAFDRVWLRGLILKLERYGIKGDLLLWLESYISNREQQVIVKDAISSRRKLKAGVPQGSILGPLLFLVFINDIADEMLGLCRLFADDTSVGERSYEINSLRDMVDIDLQNISCWSKKWLVKLNPQKTEIMYFSTRPTPDDLWFSYDNIRIYPVEGHKHLGVTLSDDVKWSKHIDIIIARATKQVAVLRKLKFIVSRNFLENIYITFIRPLLEYCCEVWDNCSITDSNRLEKVQLEAGRIATGLTLFSSINSIYQETGWEKLSIRREKRKLSLFYNIVNHNAPEYLYDLLPQTVNRRNNYNLRNANNLTVPYCRLSCFQKSYVPSSIKLWNSLDINVRQSPSSNVFKYRLKNVYNVQVKPPVYYYIGSRIANVLHTRLRHKCSSLKSDLFRCNLSDSCYCSCGNYIESAEHYFFHCKLYTEQRAHLINGISNLDIDISIDNILFGSSEIGDDINSILFLLVQKYIIDSKRFV